MRAILFASVLMACAGEEPRRTEPFPCGTETCRPDQLCATITAGHVCDTDPSRGIGEYAVLAEFCMDVPSTCGDEPSCECIHGCGAPNGFSRPCLQVYESSVSCGCF